MRTKISRKLTESRTLTKFISKLYGDNSIPFKFNLKFRNTSVSKMNRLMINFFKQPDMTISTENNIIPFRFYISDHITLNGIQYITNPESKKWIISTHDFGQNKFWALFFAKPFIELGYNILTFDFRNHGDNKEEEPFTFGKLETIDLESAINWLIDNKNPDYIGLLGVGLGAFTINNLYIEKSESFIENKIKFAICESTYTSVESLIITQRWKWRLFYTSGKNFVHSTARRKKRIFKAAAKEENVDLNDNNLIKKIRLNKEDIYKNYVPFFYTNSGTNNLVSSKDSYELIIERDFFKQDENIDKIVMYDFSESRLIFKDHFKKNMREILDFENKIMGDNDLTQQVINKMHLTNVDITDSKEEKYELVTFIHQDN